MPTYEYECTKCGVVFDLSQPITDPPRRRLKKADPKPCKCNATVHRRIGTGGGLIFKGSGFYITDYRSEKYKEAAKAEAPGGDTQKTEKKTESTTPPDKPESKSNPKPKSKS